MTSSMPKTSYNFLKIQVAAVCCIAFWLLYSPPSLSHVKYYTIRPIKTVLVSKSNQGLLARQNVEMDATSNSSDVRTPVTSHAETSRPRTKDASEIKDVDHLDAENRDQTEDDVSREVTSNLRDRRKNWIFKWDDRNATAYQTSYLSSLLINEQERATTSFEEQDRVIFNRVGKCGSRSVLTLLDRLAYKNQFHLISSQTFNEKRLDAQNEEKLVSILSEVQSPFIYQRHLHFINFTKYGASNPTYINIIRDPLERAVSQYYFIRFGDEKKQERKFNASDPNKYMSYEECVRRRLKECVGKKAFYIIPFFCGQDERCTYATEWAFKRAVENVKKYFLAVGVLEELPNSLQVFEKVLPRMFKGALKTYINFEQAEQKKKSSVGVTKYKQKPSVHTALYVKTVIMKYEYLFYNWIKGRLHDQIQELSIDSFHHGDYR